MKAKILLLGFCCFSLLPTSASYAKRNYSYSYKTPRYDSAYVAAIGAGIGAIKYANAKKAEAKEGCHKNYNEYLKVSKKPIPLSEYCSEK